MGVRPRNRGWIGDDRPDRNRVSQVLPSPGKRDPNEGRKGLGSRSAQSLLLLSRESLASPEAYPAPRANRCPSDGAWEREAPPRGLGSFQKIRTEA